jgi:hypothetical protein
MPILVEPFHPFSHPAASPRPGGFLSEASIAYVLQVPSGAVPGWFGAVPGVPGWLEASTSLIERRPRTMLQAVTFDVEEDSRLRVARLHPVDESEDDW